MRIVFFGTGAFAVPALRMVARNTVLVVTQPDRPSGRGLKVRESEVKRAAIELGLPVEMPERSRAPEFVEVLKAIEPTFFVVASYGQILSQAMLDVPKRGGINLHGSILPALRGAAPIQRAILNGFKETGVTLMQMSRGMDTGDVIDIRRVPIGPDQTYAELHDALAEVAAGQIGDWADRIATGEYPRLPQDSTIATMAPKIEPQETILSTDRSVDEAYNRYRAFHPRPGTVLETRFGRLKLAAVRPESEELEPSGTSLTRKDGVLVAFADGWLRLIEVVPEGKRPMAATAWANGVRLRMRDNLSREQ